MAVRPALSVVTVAAVVFFLLLEVAIARTPSAFGNEAAAGEVSDSLTPSSDFKSILRLPSDIVNDESHSNPDPDSQASVTHDPESAEPITVRSVPLTVLRFHDLRPINRHFFTVRSRFPFRHCRHHHHHRYDDHRFLKPVEKQAAEIPYGDDMVLSKGEEKRDLEMDAVSWVKLPYHHHHHHRRHEDVDDDNEDGFSKYLLKHSPKFGREKFKKHLHYKRRGEAEQENEERKKRENGKNVEGGFVKRIRKFLAHF